MRKDYLSVNSEPVFQKTHPKTYPSQAEKLPVCQDDEVSRLRDSVLNEPALNNTDKGHGFLEWIDSKKQNCSILGNILTTLAVSVVGGLFAIVGAFLATRSGYYGLIYVVLFGPVTEELLKQSGMIYLLEKKPYRIFSNFQFFFAAIISALIFASLENLLYIHFYVPEDSISNHALYADFRWSVCTTLHISCSMIASFGLMRTWHKIKENGKPADLSAGFIFFAISIATHGIYNLLAITLFKRLF